MISMRKLKIYKIGLAMALTASLCTGCSKPYQRPDDSNKEGEVTLNSSSGNGESKNEGEPDVNQSTPPEVESKLESEKKDDTNDILSGTDQIKNESDVALYFENLVTRMKHFFTIENGRKALNKGNEALKFSARYVSGLESVGGYTINELSDELKTQVYETFERLDELIVQYDPNYKEKLSATEKKVIERTKSIVNKGMSASRTYLEKNLTPEQLEKLDRMVEKGETTYDKAKEVVKEKGSSAISWIKKKIYDYGTN